MTRLVHDGKDPVSGRNKWSLHLLSLESSILTSLPDQIEALLTHPDRNRRVMDRLFPPSYADPEEQALNRQLLGKSLLDERRQLLDAVRAELSRGTEEAEGMRLTLTPESMDVLVRFVNDVRLVIATDLGIEENIGDDPVEPGDPDAPKYALLEYLGGVQAILVEALSREF